MLQPKLKLVYGSPANTNLVGCEVRELMQDYRAETYGLVITIPAGFQTDGASIPRSCQWLVGHPFECDFRAAALVHDWLYYTHFGTLADKSFHTPQGGGYTVTRDLADSCLLDLLAQNGVGWTRRHAIYRAVRMAGGGYWENDNNDKVYLAGLAAQITARGQNPADYGLAA